MPAGVIELLPYQRAAVESPARFTWNCWARQTGKSFAFSLRRVLRGLLRRRDQIILSAGERQSREVMAKVRMHCHALQAAMTLRGSDAFDGLRLRHLEATLPGGVRIIALPANPMTTRGFSGDVLMDEFAMHADDAAIWAALFPTLLRGDGELDIASTPRGRRNMFYRLANNGLFRHSTVTLESAVAAGLKADVAALRGAIGDETAWRQEFCCEFLDEVTAFMTLALIGACQDGALRTATDWPRLGRREAELYVGVDIGRVRDVTAAWVWERRGNVETSKRPNVETTKGQNVEMGGGKVESRNVESRNQSGDGRSESAGIESREDCEFVTRGVIVLAGAPFAEQEAVLASLLDAPGVRRCCIDASGMGLPLVERLVSHYGEHRVEGVVFTAALKSELAGLVRVLAERGRLRIPVDEGIVRDWHSISRIATSGGFVRYEADRSSGGHGDRFWAAALGLHAARGRFSLAAPGLMTDGPMRFARRGVW